MIVQNIRFTHEVRSSEVADVICNNFDIFAIAMCVTVMSIAINRNYQ